MLMNEISCLFGGFDTTHSLSQTGVVVNPLLELMQDIGCHRGTLRM
jgi:hypothetical protein